MPPSHKNINEMALCDETEKDDVHATDELAAPFWQEWLSICDHAMTLVVHRILDAPALVNMLRSQGAEHNLVSKSAQLHSLPSVCSWSAPSVFLGAPSLLQDACVAMCLIQFWASWLFLTLSFC